MALPEGTVAFLFTDVEGSTALVERRRQDHAEIMRGQATLIGAAVERHAGTVFGEEGDAVFAAFASTLDAARAALDAQVALRSHRWPDGERVAVRMGIHTGETLIADGRYHGMTLHRVARICAAAHGGQILLSDAARALLGETLPEDVDLVDVGIHRLKDLKPQRLFQLSAPSLATSFPPPRSVATYVRNLPPTLTSFVGRETWIDHIVSSLDQARLITLAGPGGIGKTTAAIRIASEIADRIAGGSFFVDLTTIDEGERVPSTIAKALNASGGDSADDTASVVSWLGDMPALIVLDNCEHVIAGAASAARALLDGCPKVTILATSRRPLRVSGETVERVPPLHVSDPGDGEGSEALELFLLRARETGAEVPADESTRAIIEEVCHRLDGSPLAIELAAARTSVLSPAEILERLPGRADLLASTSRDAPERHRSITAAVAWSYELLEPKEQELFRSLSVLLPPFGIEEADAVLEGADTLSLLESLIDHSLLNASPVRGRTEYRLPEPVRRYAIEQLDAAEEERIRDRLMLHYQELSARADEPDVARQLTRGFPNARRALDRSAEHAPAEATVRLATAIAPLSPRLSDALGCVAMLEEAQDPSLPDEQRAHASTVIGSILLSADPTAARRALLDAMAFYERARDEPAVARCHALLANVAWHETRYDLVEEHHRYALDIHRSRGDADGIANALRWLGNAAKHQGRTQEARRLFEEASTEYERASNEGGTAIITLELAYTAWAEGDLPRSRALFEECFAIWERHGSEDMVVQINMAMLEVAEGRVEDAADRCRRVLSGAETMGYWGRACALSYLGWAEAGRGDHVYAARLLGAAEALFERIGAQIPGAERAVHAEKMRMVREALGEDRWSAAFGAGRAMAPDDAVAYALRGSSLQPAPATEDRRTNVFRREADAWRISFEGRTMSLRATKGLTYLAHLLERPGIEVHVRDLADAGGLHAAASSDAGPTLDAQARAEYRRRLGELEAELAEARSWNDTGRVEKAEAELTALEGQLGAATGLGGRSRRLGDELEKIRKAVGNRIADAIRRIEAEDERLAAHLRNAIQTGRWCSYRPDHPVPWAF